MICIDMEMPKDCIRCKFRTEVDSCFLSPDEPNDYCNYIPYYKVPYKDGEKPDWCPLNDYNKMIEREQEKYYEKGFSDAEEIARKNIGEWEY